MSKTINWRTSPADRALIKAIVERMNPPTEANATDIEMDITCVHLNIVPLRLAELAEAENVDLLHDVLGIRRHLNRQRVELGGCFVPRFACAASFGARICAGVDCDI